MKILDMAKEIDSSYEKFGASVHQYRLNPPIEKSFVRNVEKRYGFTLPEDYFRFITETGDGGAGPDYGIMPFADFLTAGNSPGAERFKEAYRHSLAREFLLRPMSVDEVKDFAIVTREGYERNPDKFFCSESPIGNNELCDTYGFYVLGTHGCQWDFGLIITGDGGKSVHSLKEKRMVVKNILAKPQNKFQVSGTEIVQEERELR